MLPVETDADRDVPSVDKEFLWFRRLLFRAVDGPTTAAYGSRAETRGWVDGTPVGSLQDWVEKKDLGFVVGTNSFRVTNTRGSRNLPGGVGVNRDTLGPFLTWRTGGQEWRDLVPSLWLYCSYTPSVRQPANFLDQAPTVPRL